MKNIVCFNFKNSTNVGDQLIAETLCENLSASFDIRLYDILGHRKNNNFVYLVFRVIIVKIIGLLPKVLIHQVIKVSSIIKYKLKLVQYKNIIRKTDFILFGGGQLFRENDCHMATVFKNFLTFIEKYEKKYMFIGIGISKDWSEYSKKIFRSILNHPLNILNVLRDAKSVENYLHYQLDCGKYYLGNDLVFANKNIHPSLKIKSDNIGFCLVNPITISYYSQKELTIERVKKDLMRKIHDESTRYNKVYLFSNGNPEDQLFIRKLKKEMRQKYSVKNVYITPRGRNHQDIQRVMDQCKRIVSYRLHVYILSRMKEIDCELVKWDKKMSSLDNGMKLEDERKMARETFDYIGSLIKSHTMGNESLG